MTRVNIISPSLLTDQHLLAEVREITRLPANLYTSLNAKIPLKLTDIPPEYVLGTGHVKHFFNKFTFLKKRHEALVVECLARGFELSHTTSDIFDQVPDQYKNDWTPNSKEINLNLLRLCDKINMKPMFYRYYRRTIELDHYVKLMGV